MFPIYDDKDAAHLIFGEGERDDDAARILLRKNVLGTVSLAQDHLLGAADSALDDLDLDLDIAAGDVEPCLDESRDDRPLLCGWDSRLSGDPEIDREFLGLPHSLDFDLEKDLDFDLDADLDIDREGDLEPGKLDLDLDLDIVKPCLDALFSTELA